MGKESKLYIFLVKQLEFRENQTLFQFCWEKQKKDVQIPWGWESKNWEQLSSTLPNRLFTLCLNFQLSPRGHLGDSFGNSEYSRTKRELLSIQSSFKKKKKKKKKIKWLFFE